MRALLLTLAAALVLPAAASARSPRLEHLALRAADVGLAKSAVLRAGDFSSGWTTGVMKPDDSAPDCQGYDYSKFTITGQAQTQSTRGGALVVSRVEIYRSHADALGDFAVDARPRTAACEGAALRKQLSSNGIPVRLISARPIRVPRLGQRSTAFRITLGVTQAGKELQVSVDLVAFVRDRAVASVITRAPGSALKGNVVLARRIEARLMRVS